MPRPRSNKVAEVKAKLLLSLQHGIHPPGSAFLSTRAIAQRFGISYQTAHRLSVELAEEGWLERRNASGTYVAGRQPALGGVHLLFNARAKRRESFGRRLIECLTASLDAAGISWRISWVEDRVRLRADLLPILWEAPGALAEIGRTKVFAVLLHDRPPAGLAGSFVDSVAVDDFSGGACAAELLREACGPLGRLAALAGPKLDPRSLRRVAGFSEVLPGARVRWSPSWFSEDALPAARDLCSGYDGIFCGNDRLAAGVLEHCRAAKIDPPALIGFDDAPVAEKLELATIAIPWREIAEAATHVAQRRLAGDSTTAAQHIFAPRPVVRKSLRRGGRP